jgi:hypothetical protein
MLRMCVYMHSRFVKNHPIQILKDGPLIYEVVLSQHCLRTDFESWNSRPQLHVVEPSSSFHYVLLDVSGSSSFLRQILEEGGT